MNNASIEDVSATGVKIMDANLSDLEIEGAQLGGAYIHNIGMPPEGHPAYDPAAKQRPLKFENCDLNGSNIINCDLSNVNITECNLTGMKINGILVEDLLKKI
ncbi:pentapeptide repeat-containing protein [Mucilaginibacter sp.]|uniref:pentapeptide repeat-containing protein n=1 Tax=Mucilaginibacter sp. TaxID=1882438 RepID=UPI002626DFD7|nr:pentapeptide repeat-containing protein [Mucilaginibacter sp.]MDB4920125.1 pentapeptide repeat-containing protein [Mucilaginibacter sp.]